MGRFDELDALVTAIGDAPRAEWEGLRKRLLAAAQTFDDPKVVMDHLESAKRSISGLEARWEVDEVIEAITPPPEPVEEEEEEAEPAADKPLTAADLTLVYDDPRGLRLHKSKVGERYILTQVNPQTGQPQSFELREEEVTQIKQQLLGSPYWLVGGGA